MNSFIAQVLNESRTENLPEISLEQEIKLTYQAENHRHQFESDLNDITRTLDMVEALEGMALVADHMKTATPEQAAFIQIGGDLVVAGTDMNGEEITPSLEGVKEVGTEVSSKVRGAIETIIRALRELLTKIAGVVRKYIQAIRFAAGGHVQRLKVIKERLAQADYPLNGGEDFMFSMPVLGDESLQSLSDVLKEALKFNFQIDNFIKYTTDFNINYGSGLTDLYQKLTGDGISIVDQFSLLEKIAETTSRIRNRVSTHTAPEANVDYYDIKKFVSEPLIGGVSIVQTTVLLRPQEAALSSAMLSQAIGEMTSNIGIKVEVSHLGFGREDYSIKPLTKPEIDQAIKICEELLGHFTGKSEHSSLAISSTRRLEFAETALEHITKSVEKFKKDNIASKQYAEASLRVSNSIIQNATLPYSYMTTAVNRCLTMLSSAIMKSLNAHEMHHRQIKLNKEHADTMQHPLKPSHESISDLWLSTERIKDDIVDENSEQYTTEGLGSIVKGFFNIFKKADRSKNSDIQSRELTHQKGIDYLKETYLSDEWLSNRKWNEEDIDCDGQLTALSINAKASKNVLAEVKAFRNSVDAYYKKAIPAISAFKTQYLKVLEPLKDLDKENFKGIFKSVNEKIDNLNCPFDKLLETAPDQKTIFGGISFKTNDVRPWYDYRYKYENHFYANGKLKPFNRAEVEEAAQLLLKLLDDFYWKNDFFERVLTINPVVSFPPIKGYQEEAEHSPLHYSYLDLGGKQELLTNILLHPYMVAMMKVIIALDLLIIKSSTGGSGSKKAKPSNESITDVVYSAEGLSSSIRSITRSILSIFTNHGDGRGKNHSDIKKDLSETTPEVNRLISNIRSTYANVRWVEGQKILTGDVENYAGIVQQLAVLDKLPTDLYKACKEMRSAWEKAVGPFERDLKEWGKKYNDLIFKVISSSSPGTQWRHVNEEANSLVYPFVTHDVEFYHIGYTMGRPRFNTEFSKSWESGQRYEMIQGWVGNTGAGGIPKSAPRLTKNQILDAGEGMIEILEFVFGHAGTGMSESVVSMTGINRLDLGEPKSFFDVMKKNDLDVNGTKFCSEPLVRYSHALGQGHDPFSQYRVHFIQSAQKTMLAIDSWISASIKEQTPG